MTDFELTLYKVGDQTLDEMTTLTFLGWVAKKLNGLERYSPAMNELNMMVQRPPFGKIDMVNKIAIIRKMEKLGIEIS